MEDSYQCIQDLKIHPKIPVSYFAVFDGHGGREVAVFSNKHYENILTKDLKENEKDVKEGLRLSFLNVDVELKTP